MLAPAKQVLVRQVTQDNFFNIERKPSQGGGTGPHRIEVKPTMDTATIEFLGLPPNFTGTADIQVGVVGEPNVVAPMKWGRQPRMNTPQGRQRGERHPAWSPERRFPAADDDVTTRKDAEPTIADGLRIYVVRLVDDQYFAGFRTGHDYPPDWPDDAGLKNAWAKDGVARFRSSGTASDAATETVIRRIFDAWSRGRAALLYGPPGTSKTHIMGELRERLATGTGPQGLFLDVADASRPFRILSSGSNIPAPVATEWLTFHQSYSYEEFVLGLRPRPTSSGTELRPRLGRLLHRLHDVWDPGEPTKSAAFLLDEINRGNAARIFGELITFLDTDYRKGGPLVLPVPLPGIDVDPSTSPLMTQAIERPSGGTTRLPADWQFPEHAYFVATMNSVDRTAIPIDSALARRFDRIELRPDLGLLATWLGTDDQAVSEAGKSVRADSTADAWTRLVPADCAVLLLDRLNHLIAEDLGEDFELGHALMRPLIGASDPWATLARIWDDVLWPQVQERYVARPDQLREVLKVGANPAGAKYGFQPRAMRGSNDATASRAAEVRLSNLQRTDMIATLQFLSV